jgi:serine O-acetyltransferase
MARILDEIAHIAASDPAQPSRLAVVLTYPGFHALLLHRLAHLLWGLKLKLFALIVSAVSRLLTGIEIHPAAVIGRRCFIDHGMGVVIGQTAEIGNNVTLFQGVALGGLGGHGLKRHATVEDDVMIGAGAKLLGPITIGKGARVGANAVVTHDVAAGDTVVGIPARSTGNNAQSVAGARVTGKTAARFDA